MDDTFSFENLKLEINNALWMKAPHDTPLHVLEEAACAAIGVVNSWYMQNHNAELDAK
jgi:hypothetical protein